MPYVADKRSLPGPAFKMLSMTVYILALETSSSLCGVALLTQAGEEVRVRVLEHDATAEHAERLLTMVDKLLAQEGIACRQLSAIAFGQGKGGFTGLRVACAVAQGMALALGTSGRSEEQTDELTSLKRTTNAGFGVKKKKI